MVDGGAGASRGNGLRADAGGGHRAGESAGAASLGGSVGTRREHPGVGGGLLDSGMSHWGSAKARRVLAALLRMGWSIKRQSGGSHRVLARPGWPDFVFAFHEGEEIGPRMLARIARRTGLTRDDL